MNRITVLFFVSLIPFTAHSDDYMSADDVKVLINNRTFDGIYLSKDKQFSVYSAPDGTHNVKRSNGKRSKGRTWFVNNHKLGSILLHNHKLGSILLHNR